MTRQNIADETPIHAPIRRPETRPPPGFFATARITTVCKADAKHNPRFPREIVMGASCNFICAACGYTAEVSGQGDAGMLCETITIVCLDCRKLYDVVTARRSEMSGEFEPQTPRCPKSRRHPFRAWTEGDPCPRCAGPLTNHGLVTLWD